MLLMLSAPTLGFAKEKYAALVIDGNSGSVLHSESASEMRYPASLTKLMTLYMTFDALRTGQLRLDTVLRASKRAAGMPSTNLSMKPGDKITVRDAIKALVVRSANDVAVILAEKLGGSEYRFAKRMTATARRLGMKRTTFRNASGLPDRRQVTTARDMAVLAMALRRHYPQYYHFFRTQKFKYKKRTYASHNRAMKRISGADGLKTGYIRMSGFNLVTTAKRSGKSVIGVVMGGTSSKKRDDRMVSLIERSFARLRLQPDRRQFVLHKDPLPAQKPQELVVLAQADQPNTLSVPVASSKQGVIPIQQPVYTASVSNPKPPKAQFVSLSLDGGKTTQKLQFTPEERNTPTTTGAYIEEAGRPQFVSLNYDTTLNAPELPAERQWGVQVGAYEDPREALVAASEAVSRVPNVLKEARVHIADKHQAQGKTLHRARLADMTENQARQACKALAGINTPCFVYREATADNG
jgi:D-alanyl-D-alanine carboxypeptidase